MQNYQATASRDKTPITLFIDDTTPFINVMYYSLLQNEFAEYTDPDLTFGPYDEFLEDKIPLELLTRFINLLSEFPILGKMSMIPFPAGLGSIETRISGVADKDLARFMNLFKVFVTPRFDVSPEMLTHTKNLNLSTGQLGDYSEHDWSRNQTEDDLYQYMRHGVSTLRRVGLKPNGITSPVDFGRGNEANYHRAVQRVFAEFPDTEVCWYFLHETFGQSATLNADIRMFGGRKQACVHLPATVTDHSMELFNLPASQKIIHDLADLYITKDGMRGAIVEQLKDGSDMISLLFHWPSLYLNGRYSGLKLLREVLNRIKTHLEDSVVWATPHGIASKIAEQSV